jgi:hypothetical protein
VRPMASSHRARAMVSRIRPAPRARLIGLCARDEGVAPLPLRRVQGTTLETARLLACGLGRLPFLLDRDGSVDPSLVVGNVGLEFRDADGELIRLIPKVDGRGHALPA